ncbi:DUF2795 domain-containing protein [Bacillus sp. IT-79MI2]|nr:hypothetical protein BTH41_01013 [Bacillus mycoides]
MEPYKETHELLNSLKEKDWNCDEILGFLNQDTSKSFIKKYL